MKKELFQDVEIPEGIEVTLNGKEMTVKGPKGENKKIFKLNKIEIGRAHV